MDILKIEAETKDYIWGGKKLHGYGFGHCGENIAEAWALSFHKDGLSRVAGGGVVTDEIPREEWGKNCDKFPAFPLLVKFIDSADNLSVQVHPSDEYALARENSFGKTEMWYVVESEEGAGLYVGFKKDITIDEYARRIADNTLLDALNFIPVSAGDSYFIEAGTAHAIGKGCTIVEVQQSSNLTYRVYDYGRVGKDGKPRELHIEKALAVTNLRAYEKKVAPNGYLAECKYFSVKASGGDDEIFRADSFTALTVIRGSGVLNGMQIKRGETYFIPAGKRAKLSGDYSAIQTFVGEK